MKETFTDYIIVNIENYTIIDKKQGQKKYVCEINMLPIVPKNALVVNKEKDGIQRYVQSMILPGKLNEKKVIGSGILLKVDSNKKLNISQDETINFKFYDRCLNLALVLDSYKPLCKNKNDFKAICLIADKLENMLASRLMEVFASQNNRIVTVLSSRIIDRMRKRLGELKDAEQIVKNVMQIDKDYYIKPEYKIIDEEMEI